MYPMHDRHVANFFGFFPEDVRPARTDMLKLQTKRGTIIFVTEAGDLPTETISTMP